MIAIAPIQIISDGPDSARIFIWEMPDGRIEGSTEMSENDTIRAVAMQCHCGKECCKDD